MHTMKKNAPNCAEVLLHCQEKTLIHGIHGFSGNLGYLTDQCRTKELLKTLGALTALINLTVTESALASLSLFLSENGPTAYHLILIGSCFIQLKKGSKRQLSVLFNRSRTKHSACVQSIIEIKFYYHYWKIVKSDSKN